jgi:hypothetical protein
MKNIIFVLFVFLSFAFSLTLDLPLDNIRYEIKKAGDYDRIYLYNGSGLDRPGAPETPVAVYSFGLPYGQRVAEIRILDVVYQTIPGEYNIYPEQKSQNLGEAPSFTEPDPAIYGSDLAYPANPIVNHHSGNMRGYAIGQISFCPFQYYPRTGQLGILRKLRVDIQTVSRAGAVVPKRQSGLSRAVFDRLANGAVIKPGSLPAIRVEENPEDLAISALPSLIGPPVDLVIVTTEDKLEAYEKYARFKKTFGYNTAVKTMTWIRENYNGIDDAERLRNFIRDAVEQWGTSFIFLGADAPEIPPRIVRMEPLIGPWPTHIATDLYYSDLDGDWNRNGDSDFGEVVDSLDLYPDVLVGRVTARADSDVIAYLDKVRNYLFPQDLTGFTRALFVSSDWWSPGDARAASSRIALHLPAYFDTSFINEVSLQQFKDSLYSSYGVIGVLAHGDVNLLRVCTYPRVFATNFFFDSLTASNIIHPLMFVITCYTNPFEVDALGEHWVNNRQAGGIAYIGPTYSSSAGDHEAYTTVLVDSLFSLPLAGALAYSKIYWIPQSIYWDNWKRSFQFSQTLLGDPSLCLWDTIPRDINPVLTNRDTLELGIDSMTISLAARVKFSVVFYKADEIFIRDSGWGSLHATLKTRSPGYLCYTISSPGFRLYQDSIYVRAQQPNLTIEDHWIVDSLANNDHQVNPGEDIFIYVRLKNNGALPGQNISATLSCPDSFLALIQDWAAYPDIDPNGYADNPLPFHIRTSFALPDEHSLNCQLVLNYNGDSARDTFQMISRAPQVVHFGQIYGWSGDTADIAIYLKNEGHAPADSLTGRARALSDSVTVFDSLVSFPPVLAGAIVSSDPDRIRVLLDPGAALKIRLGISNRGQEIIDRTIHYDSPAPTALLWHEGRTNSIILRWTAVMQAAGYRIYRSAAHSGPYQFLDNPREPLAYYEDGDVTEAADYYYYVTTLDSAMNEGPASDTIEAQTNPRLAPGWPVAMQGYTFSSPNYGNIDPAYPGLEIVVGGKDGALYAWHCDGTPVAGNGMLLATGAEIWGSPAIGDVNHDGQMEICVGIRGLGENNLYVMNGSGIPLPGWPRSVEWGVLTSPVLSDVDEDSNLEIFVISESGKLYAFRHDGTAAFHDTCVLKQLSGGLAGSPAIGDINRDGFLEIVCPGGVQSESLFVWDHEGNSLPPFPVAVVGRMKYSAVLGDVSGDSHLEICFYTDSTEYLNVVTANGSLLWQRNFSLGDVEASPIIANVAGDPRPEIVCGNNLGLAVFDSLGNLLPGFPLYDMEHNWKLPISADLDADSVPDIACGSNDWAIYAHRPDGSAVKGFPIPMGNRVECSPAVADLDGDGKLEFMTGDFGFKFYVFDLKSEVVEWPKFRYDQYNTGCYHSGNWHGIRTGYTRRAQSVFLLRAAPNPFRNRLYITFGMGQSAPLGGSGTSQQDFQTKGIALKIYDISGRLVKSFTLSSATNLDGPDAQSLLWSGDDDQGRRVAAGIYFIKLESGGSTMIRKIIRVR